MLFSFEHVCSTAEIIDEKSDNEGCKDPHFRVTTWLLVEKTM